MSYALTPQLTVATTASTTTRRTAQFRSSALLRRPTDRYERYDIDRSVVIVSTATTPTDRANYKELALPTAIVAIVTTPVDRAGRKELTLPTTVVSTITTPVDQADFKDLQRSVAIVAVVAVQDSLVGAPNNYNETGRLVLVTATVTPTDQADFKQLALLTTITSTVTRTDLLVRRETLLVPVVSTLTFADQADFKDLVKALSIVSTLTVDDFTGGSTSGTARSALRRRSVSPIRPISRTSSPSALVRRSATDQADYHQVLAIPIVATIRATDLQRYANGVVLNDALAVYLGNAQASRVYAGTVQVWP